GSFILILLGNYVLLLVDSVNALYDTISEIFSGNFDFVKNSARIRMLKVLGVFTLGSVTGLVTFSHVLNYILKHYKNSTLATLLGFIVGSLGVVWPWKRTIYKTDSEGLYILDSTGSQIVENYERFFPEATAETYIAIAYIVLGILIVLGLEWYGQRTRQVKT
ncbi:MAG: DUF368 domain-containing protein, partial [Bacteroidota bacterium]